MTLEQDIHDGSEKTAIARAIRKLVYIFPCEQEIMLRVTLEQDIHDGSEKIAIPSAIRKLVWIFPCVAFSNIEQEAGRSTRGRLKDL